jgi:hypothetical protein
MLEQTKARALPVVNQAADSAPVVVACCNACRVCITGNIVGLILAGATAATTAVVGFAKRFAHPAV